MKNENTKFDEQNFNSPNMSNEEVCYYLDNIIKNCKDVCETSNKVGGENQCNVVSMTFKKDENKISFNGVLSISYENRCVNGVIFTYKDKILVEMNVTRLCYEGKYKEYIVFDEFKLENNDIIRKSCYDYSKNTSFQHILNDELKGKLL